MVFRTRLPPPDEKRRNPYPLLSTRRISLGFILGRIKAIRFWIALVHSSTTSNVFHMPFQHFHRLVAGITDVKNSFSLSRDDGNILIFCKPPCFFITGKFHSLVT